MQPPLDSRTSQSSSDLALLGIALLVYEMGVMGAPALYKFRPQGWLSQDPNRPPLRPTKIAGMAPNRSLGCVRPFATLQTVARQASVRGIFQARILEWVATCFSMVSSRPRG